MFCDTYTQRPKTPLREFPGKRCFVNDDPPIAHPPALAQHGGPISAPGSSQARTYSLGFVQGGGVCGDPKVASSKTKNSSNLGHYF